MIARLFRFVECGMPRGTAQLTSTPSRSRRRSQCSAVAWCSWMTKRGSSSDEVRAERVGRHRLGRACPPCAWRCTRRAGRRPFLALRRGIRAARAGRRSTSARSSTSSNSRWRRSGSSSSSHVRGAATVGSRASAQRVRRDRGLRAVVLAPVDEHPARPHRPSPSARRRARDGRPRSRGRARCATAVTWSLVCVPGSAAYRWMPLLPLVTGNGSSPIPFRMSRAQRATSAHSARPTPGPGSRSRTSRSALPRPAVGVESPLRDVQLEARDLREVDERRHVADRADSPWLRSEWGIGIRCTHSGAPRSRSFAKNDGWSTPSGQRSRVTGRPVTCGISSGAMRE